MQEILNDGRVQAAAQRDRQQGTDDTAPARSQAPQAEASKAPKAEASKAPQNGASKPAQAAASKAEPAAAGPSSNGSSNGVEVRTAASRLAVLHLGVRAAVMASWDLQTLA